MDHSAKFFVGQIVHHTRSDYRGVVFDVDATFQGTDEWYELVARSRPPKDLPWYHVLVDGAEHITYVAERHLVESNESDTPINHPLVGQLCGEFHEGRYSVRSWLQ
jgi:heat shock protein HspQ